MIYRNNTILNKLSNIFKEYYSNNYNVEEIISSIYTQINELLKLSTIYGFNTNVWQNYLTFILVMNENPFTLISEKNSNNSNFLNEFIKNDLNIFKKLFDYDFETIEKELEINCFSQLKYFNINHENIINKEVSVKIQKLSNDLNKTNTVDEFYTVLTKFYQDYGVGNFGLNRAFKISHNKNEDLLVPITSFDNEVILDDIIGYHLQKDKLINNTEAFVNGKRANNILLYGDAGTGKSTSIKAIINQYYENGLRIIEIYKHEMKYLPEIMSKIKNRNYRFILYMDDLSFEESETDYKFLKSLIDGGIEAKPDNVVIYATSNRRHIIRENWNERTTISNEEMYESDTVGEKLSLVNRFGITIGYYKPTVKEYYNIVIKKARKYPEIKLNDEQLIDIANKWIMNNHSEPSGRVAEQLIIHLIANS